MAQPKKDLTDFIRNQRSEENYAGLPLKGVRVMDMSRTNESRFEPAYVE